MTAPLEVKRGQRQDPSVVMCVHPYSHGNRTVEVSQEPPSDCPLRLSDLRLSVKETPARAKLPKGDTDDES